MSCPELLTDALARFFGSGVAGNPVPVGGHGSHRSWFVTVADERIVAKLPERSGGITVGPALEYEILLRAAERGLSPQPVGFDAAAGVLFLNVVSNCSELDLEIVAEESVIAQIAEAVRILHTIEVPSALRSYDPVGFAQRYRAHIDDDAAGGLCEEIQRLTDRCGHQLVGEAICHNDLHAANILIGERLWLIDFEYAVQAAPIVDIASYVAFNGLDDAAAVRFAMHCLAGELPFSAEQLNDAVRIQRLLAELWESARSDNNASS